VRDQVSSKGTTSFDDLGSGSPVILLHAFPLSRAMWAPQIEALQDSYRVIAPDLRGFGGSQGFTETPSLDRMADDVAELLDELQVRERVVLGGLSMGGYTAFAFARRHADRLRGLILADTKAEPDDDAAKAYRARMIAFAAEHSALDVLEQLLDKLVCPETMTRRPEVVATVRHIAASQSSAAIIGSMQAMRGRPDSRLSLAAIAVPTLVVVGENDTFTPPALSETLASGIRGAKLVRIPGAGHFSNLENPVEFNAAVRSFLQALPEA
jgi:pimeloyl-ACP methyl ester carboxylesterase